MIWINKKIPKKGFIAMALFPFIFVRKDKIKKFTDRVKRHEKTHFEQQKELSLIFFLIWYGIEWFIKVFKYGGKAYNNISFEREAKGNEHNPNYLKTRKRYSNFKYLIN